MDPLGLSGQVLDDKYAVDTVVGEGGFAVVYKAMHLVLKRPVALKVFHTAVQFTEAERETLLQGFVQEAAVLADLSERSAAICQARDVGTLTTPAGARMPYMVLEWLEGKTLEALLEEEAAAHAPRRSIDQIVRLLEPIAEALALAHSKKIAHRDVKPSNIFILGDDRQGAVKLLDFGIAKVVEASHKTFSRTNGETSSFTPAYGAPEQFSRDHGATGSWTDVFALALVMVEAVTGKPPLDGENFMQLAFASSDPRKRPTPRSLGARVSDKVEAIFRKALAVSPEDRYQSAGELWTALQDATGVERRSGFADVSGFVVGEPPALDLPDIDLPGVERLASSPPPRASAPPEAKAGGAYGMVDFEWDEGNPNIELKGDAPSPSPSQGAPAAPPARISQRPSAASHPARGGSGIELATGVRSMGPSAEPASESGGGSPLGLAVVTVLGLAVAAGLVHWLHRAGGWKPFDHMTALTDGTSAALTGGAAAVTVMLCIVAGSLALLREPRAWAMLLTSVGFLGMGIGLIVVTVSATPAGEVGPPPEGAFLVPLGLPFVPLGAALSLLVGGVRSWRDEGGIVRGLALAVMAGGLMFAALELAFGARMLG